MSPARCRPFALVLAAGLAGPAVVAQVATVAITTQDTELFGARNTDAGLGVNSEAIVVTTNQKIAIFDKTGFMHESSQIASSAPDPGPFILVDQVVGTGTGYFPSRFFDPQSEYDPHTGRLWMVYSELNDTDTSTSPPTVYGSGAATVGGIHVAVSKQMTGGNELDSFADTDWWFYTGDPEDAANGGPYFDLTDTNMNEFVSGGPHDPLPGGFVDKPHLSIDEQAAYVALVGKEFFAGVSALAIIPKSHGTGLSILDGDKPAASDMTFMRFAKLSPPDFSQYHALVQEPRVETAFLNAQFVLSYGLGSLKDGLRLGGLYKDATTGEWTYRQRLNSLGAIEEMNVGVGKEFFTGNSNYNPTTPDDGCSTSRPLWDIHAASLNTFIPSAVLVYSGSSTARIFAVHRIAAPDYTANPVGPEARYVLQWYVIDPDLANLRNNSVSWEPEILFAGRIDGGEGDRIHPVMAVSPQGVAYIEYTYVDEETWPQIRRAQLSNSYTSVVSDVLVQAGPETAYIGADNPNEAWADFADMQADPDGCGFWSVHTLVTTTDTPVCQVNARDVWLFELAANCNNSNLNFDETTDLYDMALFNSFYATGARRVDMNTDGTTDATDAALYQNAYDAATGP